MRKGKPATLHTEITKSCHAKLMTTVFVNYAKGYGRPTISQSAENVATVEERFIGNPQKSARYATRKSGIGKHTIRTIFYKEFNFRLWKPP